jgi:murein DD-endopeptidase MepM/ murein hydrolase activator NlpD
MKSAATTALLLLGAGALRAFSPVLPTDNDALFRGKPEQFYMYTDRDFEGVKSRPWQGGAYGFTRNQQRVGGQIVLTKFHEGIDVKPLKRDASGEPLDEIRAIESGRVVHTSNDSKDSNYGKLAIVEHDVAGTPVYSIYAHLATVEVRPGQTIAQGDRIGRLGYTGAGINQRRAHLHLEIALLWHDGFESWHPLNFPTANKHGLYNGINLMGLDVAQFYLQRKRNPSLTLPQFVRQQEPFFRVRLPESPHFQLPRRYPWLVKGDPADARSWVVSFTAPGFPVSIEASREPAEGPRVEWVAASKFPYSKMTRRLVDGSRSRPILGESGKKLVDLIAWDPASRPARQPEGGLSDVSANLNLPASDE